MFMALHRIISYLGRRGCWVTAFNFAKLLFSLDPMVSRADSLSNSPCLLTHQNDPHGAAFWLDFLAIKSGNHAWLLSMFEEQGEQFPAAVFQGYPGMAFAYALACRAREDAEKSKVSRWDCFRGDGQAQIARIGCGAITLYGKLYWLSLKPLSR